MARYNTLHLEYLDLVPTLIRLQKAMVEQLEQLVFSSGLTLGVPIESRIKTWDSISEKLERKSLRAKVLSDVDDLLGLRVIFLFQRDLDLFETAVEATFKVLSAEDISQRLADAQFGYKSKHYLLNLPSEWEGIPSLRGLTQHKIEVQVRTLAQHIWAAASHKLQYKHEESVPLPIRRSIYRVSALLETVDLEFARVLTEREEYVKTQAERAGEDDKLDVTILEAMLDEAFPSQNKDLLGEDYSDVLVDLQHFKIGTRGELHKLLSRHVSECLQVDATTVVERLNEIVDDELNDPGERLADRLARGVFFTHVGLLRQALYEEFGSDVMVEWQLTRGDDS